MLTFSIIVFILSFFGLTIVGIKDRTIAGILSGFCMMFWSIVY